MIKISKTYEIVTEESAEYGDAEERGFEWEGVRYTFRELIDEMENYNEASCCWIIGDFWITSEADQDFRTGSYTSYSLHYDRDQPERHRKYWAKAWAYVGARREQRRQQVMNYWRSAA